MSDKIRLSFVAPAPSFGTEREQRSLWDGSQERPNAHARLLLQLDDLPGYTTAAAPSTIARAVPLITRTRLA